MNSNDLRPVDFGIEVTIGGHVLLADTGLMVCSNDALRHTDGSAADRGDLGRARRLLMSTVEELLDGARRLDSEAARAETPGDADDLGSAAEIVRERAAELLRLYSVVRLPL